MSSFPLIAGNAVVQVKGSYKWSECKDRVLRIQSGQIVFNNSTIASYIYSGPVSGISPDFSRGSYLALTYGGCKEICGNPIAWYSPETSLALVANWIFPLNILLSLPVSDETTSTGAPTPDVELTSQLLVNLAFQLRMLRRRGVIPMLANLATFLVEFIFLAVLAFAELGDESSPFSLSLVCW